jgi:hypothetical protein
MTNWLSNQIGPLTDVSTGSLFPYVKSKKVYLCPTDEREIEMQKPAPAVKRAHSYRINCMMCHAHDSPTCIAPSRTIFFLEATNATKTPFPSAWSFLDGMMSPPPVPGMPPPPILAAGVFTPRHNQRGFSLMNDIHIEKMNKQQYTTACADKRFWYPTDRSDVAGKEEP